MNTNSITELRNLTIDEIISEVHRLLTDKFQVKVVAICKGGMMEPLQRPEQQPYIIFEHSDKSLKYIKHMMFIMEINMSRINDFLKSSFDKKTQVLRWLFMPPSTMLRFTSEQDRITFWMKVYNALYTLDY